MTPYFDDGQIQIWHGDCRDVLPGINPATVSLVLTDPPYGYQQSDQARSKRAANDPGRDSGLPMIHGDTETFDPSPLLRFGRLVLFGANHYADRLPASKSWLVWDRLNGSTPSDNADAELIWTNCGGTIRMYRQTWRGVAREDDGLEPNHHVHPTQKPVKLMIWLLDRYTKPGDLVLDPYMGSGPVAHACHITGRKYIGIELVETYCQTAVKRLQQSVLPFEVPA